MGQRGQPRVDQGRQLGGWRGGCWEASGGRARAQQCSEARALSTRAGAHDALLLLTLHHTSVSQFGFETHNFALHGLWSVNMEATLDIAAQVGAGKGGGAAEVGVRAGEASAWRRRSTPHVSGASTQHAAAPPAHTHRPQHFNAIRMPFSCELALDLDGKAPDNINYGTNPTLQGLSTGAVMDRRACVWAGCVCVGGGCTGNLWPCGRDVPCTPAAPAGARFVAAPAAKPSPPLFTAPQVHQRVRQARAAGDAGHAPPRRRQGHPRAVV